MHATSVFFCLFVFSIYNSYWFLQSAEIRTTIIILHQITAKHNGRPKCQTDNNCNKKNKSKNDPLSSSYGFWIAMMTHDTWTRNERGVDDLIEIFTSASNFVLKNIRRQLWILFKVLTFISYITTIIFIDVELIRRTNWDRNWFRRIAESDCTSELQAPTY